jgi:hypothetical protein
MVEVFLIVTNLTCFGILVLALIYWFLYPIFSAPFYASSSRQILKLFDIAYLGPEDRFIDLGSGDGRVALAASRVCTKAVGIEVNPFLTLFSRFMALLSVNGQVEFKNKNLWNENLSTYDVVYVYLSKNMNQKVASKLDKELVPGSRVICNNYRIKDWKPSQIADNRYYLYVIGEHK